MGLDSASLYRTGVERASPINRMESVVSSVMDNLFFAYEATKTLRASMGELGTLLTEESLARMHAREVEVLETADKIDDAAASTQAFVAQIETDSRNMARHLKDLDQAIQSAGIVALNARIIAQGHRGLKQGQQLVWLAENISGISAEASQQVAGMLSVIEDITKAVTDLRKLTEDRSSALHSWLKPRAKALAEALASLKRGVQASQRAGSWLSNFVSQSENDISAMIAALQIGDRSRQRAEHVHRIHEEAANFAHSAPEAVILRILAQAQLVETTREASSETNRATEQMVHLTSNLHGFRDQCLAVLNGFEHGRFLDRSRTRPTGDLFDLNVFDDKEAAARSALSDGDTALREFSDGLSNASFRMQLASINTIIACARVGRQAADMIVISQQINEVISGVPVSFKEFSTALDNIKGHLTTSNEDESDTNTEINQAVTLLDAPDPSINRAREVLGQLIPQLSDEVPRVIQALQAGEEMLKRLDGDLARYAQTAKDARTEKMPANFVPNDTFLEILGSIRTCYTMSEERDLHDSILEPVFAASGKEVEKPAAEPEAASDDLDDIFF